jgi:hypothetical protein
MSKSSVRSTELFSFLKIHILEGNNFAMKTLILSISFFISLFTTAQKQEVLDSSLTYAIDIDRSIVAWRGEVTGVYSHNGVISIKEGFLDLIGDSLVGGMIVIDMTTIVPLDSASFKPEESEGLGKVSELIAHLGSDDFFSVETYPIATFVIKSISDNKIVGDLTIRDKTNQEIVDLSEFNITEERISAKGILVFDRQKYDVAWAHYMKDLVLLNEISLVFTIKASR